jgi:uncharacterized Ntn-hydrolase superfamily protein
MNGHGGGFLRRSGRRPARPRTAIVALAIVATILHPQVAFATWSIVAVDRVTREVGSAGASCTAFVAGIVGLAPGRGVIVAQAMSNATARRRGVALLMERTNPADVLKAIIDPRFDPNWEDQQYGIAALDVDRAVGFTGARTHASRGDRQGSGFSVQGNILTGAEVLDRAFATFTASSGTSLSLAERLLSALEAGAAAGGDTRCGSQTARSSYLVVAKPGDAADRPSVRLIVPGQRRGRANPVILLREMFDRSKGPK